MQAHTHALTQIVCAASRTSLSEIAASSYSIIAAFVMFDAAATAEVLLSHICQCVQHMPSITS